jgi:hypothetical protein
VATEIFWATGEVILDAKGVKANKQGNYTLFISVHVSKKWPVMATWDPAHSTTTRSTTATREVSLCPFVAHAIEKRSHTTFQMTVNNFATSSDGSMHEQINFIIGVSGTLAATPH